MAKSSQSYIPYQVVEPTNSSAMAHLQPFLQRWPWFVLSLVVALAGAYVYLLYQQPIYRTKASLMLQDEKRGSEQSNPLKELETYSPKKVVENELEVLKSSSLMGRVVDNLNLTSKYLRQTSFGKREIYANSPVIVTVVQGNDALYKKPVQLSFVDSKTVRIDEKNYPLNQLANTPYGELRIVTRRPVSDTTESVFLQAMPRAAAIGNYLGKLKAEPTSKTSTVINLTLDDAVPEKGEAVLAGLIQEYNQAAVLDKNKVAASTLKFVEERLRMVSGELSSVERDVQSYKSSQGITDLSSQATALVETARQNDAQLNQINIQLASLNDLQKFINNSSGKRSSTPATLGLTDATLLGQINKLSDLELERETRASTTSEENPLLVTLDKQIRNTKANISQNIETMKTQLENSQREYSGKSQQTETSIRAIPQQERALVNITRQQGIKNDLYTYLLKKREELAVLFAATQADSRIVDLPTAGSAPVKPVGAVMYALFGLVGLLVPTALIAGKSAVNTKVTRRLDVEDMTHVPILGEVMNKRKRDVMVVGQNMQSVIAEQIRTIRTNLQIGNVDLTASQVILFTSSISGEGKSFVSLNLGASMAMLKQPTVILEMDLRMPRLHQVFGIDNSVGLSNYLNGEATLDEILQPVPGHPNYFIIPSGPLPPNPSELLSGLEVRTLMSELRERFRYIMVDAPPIGIVTDAQLLAPMADSTLFVVRHGITPKHCLKILDNMHKEQRFQNLSIILNAVERGNSYHYSHQYKNSYSYR